ncbi:MAG: benzoate/H(+) symporter BenE family transporter [Pseudomonadota bacterium]
MNRGNTLLSDFSLSAFIAGVLSAFVGFAGSFAIVVQGLSAAGASPGQAASGLMALAVAMGLGGIILSLKSRMPISVAWSTPGGALLATTGAPAGGFEAAVGAFLVTSLLIVLAGLWKPLGRWVTAIPANIANAMLAGVLLYFCLQPAQAVADEPWLALPVIAAWAIMLRVKGLYAVPAALAVMVLVIVFSGRGSLAENAEFWISPVFIMPVFDMASIIGIAVPLFLVTMASQNIPGIATLNGNGYSPPAGPLFTSTGVLSFLAAPFGGHGVNLAAITAGMCAGSDAHPDPARRYWSAIVGGACYIVYGLLAGLVTALIAGSPTVLINAVAGLALIGTFIMALTNAFTDPEKPKDDKSKTDKTAEGEPALGKNQTQAPAAEKPDEKKPEPVRREPAAVTFLVTASGLSLFGIGSAFWGLAAGIALTAILHAYKPVPE